jgi:ubiquinone/menaquinone biosynthesis C-methylase UbiE
MESPLATSREQSFAIDKHTPSPGSRSDFGHYAMKPNEQYFAANAEHEAEVARLGLIEQLLDPLTLRRFVRLGVAPSWRCLLVAAGRGSVAQQLAERVGPTGHVVATDRDVRFLREAKLPDVEIREHDIVRDPLETGHFDLVHCRYLLMHVSEPDRVLQKMTAALRPGGWLLVEEPDDTAAGPVNASHPDATPFYQANRAMLEGLKATGVMDPYLGRRLADLLFQLGLESVECEGVTWIHHGGDVAARLVLETLALQERCGRYSPVDLEATRRALSDPGFSFVDTTWFGAQGRRPTPARTNDA